MYSKHIKRIIDLSIAILISPFVIVLLLLVYIIVKCLDNGPFLYSSTRIGRNGQLFKMHKIRTMMVNAPDIRLIDGSTYNGDDDPRVTKVGRILRKTSIDELPQIINVLFGEMSFIGPRPDPADWLDKYPDEIRVFLKMRPGITGYSQAYFRNSADGEQKMQNDVYYAQNCTFIFDIKILIRTILTIIRIENTYKDTSEQSNQLDDEGKKKFVEMLKK